MPSPLAPSAPSPQDASRCPAAASPVLLDRRRWTTRIPVSRNPRADLAAPKPKREPEPVPPQAEAD
jgi:hypothetical protein